MNTFSEKKRIYIMHSKPWCEDIFNFSYIVFPSDKYELFHISDKREFEAIKDFTSLDYLLFVHWNWLVPKSITDNHTCICFHMTDLPYGRGGSPLQNLIIRGVSTTKLSAIRMTQTLDAGPVYLKRNLTLNGTALEIYLRAGQLSLIMAKEILTDNLQPILQDGRIVEFPRLTPKDNLIKEECINFEYFKDMVRMVDAPGYPSAYILYGGLKINFNNVTEIDEKLTGQFTVERIKNED